MEIVNWIWLNQAFEKDFQTLLVSENMCIMGRGANCILLAGFNLNWCRNSLVYSMVLRSNHGEQGPSTAPVTR